MVNDVLLRPGLNGPDGEIYIAEGERTTGCKVVAEDAKRKLMRQCFQDNLAVVSQLVQVIGQ